MFQVYERLLECNFVDCMAMSLGVERGFHVVLFYSAKVLISRSDLFLDMSRMYSQRYV
jgi:hypothetical protein